MLSPTEWAGFCCRKLDSGLRALIFYPDVLRGLCCSGCLYRHYHRHRDQYDTVYLYGDRSQCHQLSDQYDAVGYDCHQHGDQYDAVYHHGDQGHCFSTVTTALSTTATAASTVTAATATSTVTCSTLYTAPVATFTATGTETGSTLSTSTATTATATSTVTSLTAHTAASWHDAVYHLGDRGHCRDLIFPSSTFPSECLDWGQAFRVFAL